MKSQKVTFRKSQKLLAENLHERRPIHNIYSIAIHSISKAGYVTTVLTIVRTELRTREASSFCDFWKITSCDFTLFLFFVSANVSFLCAW